jgi:glycosyltransferase involved in cell wall biosynthesis
MNAIANKPGIAAIILTKNEERDLPECLHSIKDIATEVYVIDSGSTDATHEIVQAFGATLLIHPFESHAKQFNWALDSIVTKADWLLRIDADESLHSELTSELQLLLPSLPDDVTGVVFPRRIRFMGHDIKFGDMYPVWLLRLWRNGEGRCEDRWMDERITLTSGQTVRVRGDLIHNIPKSLTDWTAKHNRYATLECTDILSTGESAPVGGVSGDSGRLKRSVYSRLPLFYRAFAYWFYRYVLKLGFLDGKEGLIYHFLHSFWYRFLVDAKLYESLSTANIQQPSYNSDSTHKRNSLGPD